MLPVLEARALQLVARALAGPDWDAILACREDPLKRGNYGAPYTDPDPRVLAIFAQRLAGSDAFTDLRKEACARVESEARLIVSDFPRRVRDLLVLANRNADRESLMEPWIEGASQSRRSLTAYYAQRIVREEDEDSVWDRYSAAAKILAGQGWSKTAIADGIGIGVKRIDRLLDRTSGQDIADDDPLCDMVPDLRGRREAWRDASLARARKPKPFSRLSVDEKVALAEESTDPVLLDRLAKQNSGRISGALVTRYLRRGDVGEKILRTILLTSPWMGPEVIEAHQQRPLPQGIVIAMAEDDPRVLLDRDDSTAQAAKSLGRKDFDVVLAFRESDTHALERILTAGLDLESFRQFVDLLIERLPTDELIDSNSLLMAALQHAVEQHAVTKADDVRLMRLALALVNHYGAGGDVGEEILQTILSTGPLKRWGVVRYRMRIVHQRRPLPKDIAIALAGGRRTRTAGSDSNRLRQLVDLDAGVPVATTNGIDIDIEFSDGKKISKKLPFVNPQIISDTFDRLFQKPGDSFMVASRGEQVDEQNYFQVALEADEELTAEYREGDEDHHYRCVTNDRSAVERALWSWATGAGEWRDLLRWERLHFSD